ncbi:hypothetical protein P3T35_006007 [Kitasatospora sp. GP30]|uniref:hypothetical protein n=1 Tax=Kitasatospora sp. GP30 TaxID=3035084 RepID=UPI0015D5D9FB|nr:hypothetical protein [Kitasatospora sp. GP30]
MPASAPTCMSQALHTLAAQVGPDFVLTMAPQTMDMYTTGSPYFQRAWPPRTS